MLNCNNDESIVDTYKDIKRFIESIEDRLGLYLNEEMNININYKDENIYDVNSMELKSITSIMYVEDKLKTTILFSFEDKLIDKMFREITSSFEVEEDEEDMYIEETAGDTINVILGNVLTLFQKPDMVFDLSIPFIINKEKSISKFNEENIYKKIIKTNYGELFIYCMIPGYDNENIFCSL